MNSANENLQSIRNQKATITKAYEDAKLKLETKYASDMAILKEEEKEWLSQFEDVPVEMIYKNEIRKYRRKPLIVEAFQTDHEMEVETINGIVIAKKGDYIVKDIKGISYPCDREIFEETYEEV